MASFTEQATLKVIDQSSSQIKKINAALKQLFATAKSLKSIKVDINVNVGKLAAANQQVNALARNLGNLGRHSRSINVDTSKLATANKQVNTLASSLGRLHLQRINLNANTSGIQQAHNRLNSLRAAAARPFTMGQFVGMNVAGQAVRGVGRALVAGTKDASVADTNLDMLQLGERRRKIADAMVKKAEDELASYPGAQQFSRAQIEGRYAENLRQVREGEAAKNLRIPLDANKPWGATRAATEQEMRDASEKRMEFARQRTVEELHVADMIAKDTGVPPSEAIKKVQGYFKALDQAGHLTDDFGNFDPKKMKEAGEFVRSMRMAVGEEFTGQFLATLVRREKGAKYGLNYVGQAIAGYIAEDQGPSTAGTALSSWMQQAHIRSITKEAVANQLKAGLIKDPVYAPGKPARPASKGRPARPATRGKLLSATVVDSEMSMAEPLKYARTRLVPALKTMGLTDDEIFSNAPENIDKVTTAINKLYSNTNSANFALTLMTKLLELEKQEADRLSRDPSATAVRESNKDSVTASINAVKNQFQSVLGQLVQTAAPTIGKVSTGISEFLRTGADDIKEAGEGGPGAIAAGLRAAGKFAMVAGPAMAGYMGLRKLMEVTGAGEAIGYTSGMMALTSENEGVRALGSAGMSLIEAAGALKGAAAALGGPSVGGVDIDPTTGKPKPKTPGGTPGGKPGFLSRTGTFLKDWGTTIGLGIWSAAKYVKANPAKFIKGGGWLAAAGLAYEFVESLPDDAKTRRDRGENREQLTDAKRKLINAERLLGILESQPKPNQKLVEAQRKQIKDLKNEISERTTAYEASQFGAKATPVPTTKLKPEDQPTNLIPGATPIFGDQGSLTKAVTDGVQAKPVPVTKITPDAVPVKPLPGSEPILPSTLTKAVTDGVAAKPVTKAITDGVTAKPVKTETIKAPAITAAAAEPVKIEPVKAPAVAPTLTAAAAATPTPVDSLALLIPQLAATSSSINLAVSGLTAAGTTFATTFSTGASAIGTAGQTAASTLQGAAPGIGATIGNAAAAAISAATANITVNVNNNASQAAPKGENRAAN